MINRYKFERIKYSDIRQSITKKIIAVILAIFCTFVVGVTIACMVTNKWSKFGNVFAIVFTQGFTSFILFNSTASGVAILIVAALSFLIAFKAGLFNMGISGQMVAGATVATLLSQLAPLPPGLNQIVILLLSIGMGMIVCGLIGVLKAYLNVHEVVSSIMLNWIIYYMSILLLHSFLHTDSSGEHTVSLHSSLGFVIQSQNSLINGPWISLLIMAAILIVITAIFLKFTVSGKKQIVTGLSKTASQAAGYNINVNLIKSMLFSGAIAGVLGVMVYCGQKLEMPCTTSAKSIPLEGFNGISIGLISMCSQIATVPISIFFSMVQSSADKLASIGIDSHMPDVILGTVVYGAAIISLFYNIKPYWWTFKIFKGVKASKLKKMKNLDELALLEFANERGLLLHKYYQFKIEYLKTRSSLYIPFSVKVSLFMLNIRYKIRICVLKYVLWKKPEWIKSDLKTLLLNNKRMGLDFRKLQTKLNNENERAFRLSKSTFSKYGVDEINTKKELKILEEAFSKAYFLTKSKITEHYKKINEQLLADKKNFVVLPDYEFEYKKSVKLFESFVIEEVKDRDMFIENVTLDANEYIMKVKQNPIRVDKKVDFIEHSADNSIMDRKE